MLFTAMMLSGDDAFKPDEAAMPIGSVGKPASTLWPRSVNPLHVLVVFTKWKGELPNQTTVPDWANSLFTGQPGGVDDYFDAVSFGQYKVTGEFLPKMYEMPYDTTYYKKSSSYAQDIVKMLDEDPTVNLANYDNDGIDGIPNSGDDDGYVDYMIDHFGFRQGDRAILMFADILKELSNTSKVFIGHIGGDDFFAGFKLSEMDASSVYSSIRGFLQRFSGDVLSLYRPKDREQGYYISTDREGNERKYPLIGVSAGVLAIPAGERGYSLEEVFAYLASLKKQAKQSPEKCIVHILEPGKFKPHG